MASSIHRIVVVAEPSPGGHRRLEAAARLAARQGKPLEALFLENEALLRGAALPFTCEIARTNGRPRPLATDQLERHFQSQARTLHRHLAALASRLALAEWSFRVKRGNLRDVVGAESGDLVILGRSAGAASPLEDQTKPSSGTVMVVPNAELAEDRPVVALIGEAGAGGERTLAMGLELAADPEASLQILVPPLPVEERSQVAEAVAAWLQARGLAVPVQLLTGWEGAGLAATLHRLRPQALVLRRNTPGLEGDEGRLLARLDAPLVMVP